MDLNQTRCFVEVVRAGGFAAAARRLDSPKSTISARIQALEARLGAQLLQRSTRRVELTPEGAAYFEAVASAVDALVDAEAASSAEEGVLAGKIRFAAPLDFPREALTGALASFSGLNPRIRFDLVMTDRRVDLVAEHFDLALHSGALASAGPGARAISDVELGLYASPNYLAKRGRPGGTIDLDGHDLLLFGPAAGLPAHAEALLQAAEGEPKIVSDSFGMLRLLALAGAGIAVLPDAYVEQDVSGGELERVIETWSGEPAALFLLFPARRELAPRVRAFADHLARWLT